jgi:hypothetical protein
LRAQEPSTGKKKLGGGTFVVRIVDFCSRYLYLVVSVMSHKFSLCWSVCRTMCDLHPPRAPMLDPAVPTLTSLAASEVLNAMSTAQQQRIDAHQHQLRTVGSYNLIRRCPDQYSAARMRSSFRPLLAALIVHSTILGGHGPVWWRVFVQGYWIGHWHWHWHAVI